MDLKTFAVSRKLQYDEDLLSYVVKQEPVPIPLIEASFRDYMDSLTDTKSERLIANYKKMLGEDVPVLISRDKSGGYDVSGEIPDSMVDAIMTVHNVTKDDIVKALVDYNLATIHGQTCDIVSLSLEEQAERTLVSAASIPTVVPVSEAAMPDMDDSLMGEPDPGIMGEPDPDPIQDTPDIPAIEPAFMEPAFTEDVPDMDMPDLPMEGPDAEAAADVLDNMTDAGEPEEPVMEDTKELPLEPPMEADPYSGPTEETEQTRFAESIRRIYDKFVADLKAYGLDSRLNLAM